MKNLSLKELRKNKKKKGFTLVELIIVIAIMAILAAVAIPKFGEVTKGANITADVATAKNLHGIAAQYLAENPTTTGDVSEVVGKKVDGGSMPTSKVKNAAFTVHVTADGDINVYAGAKPTTGNANEVYPNQGTEFQKNKTTSSSGSN